MRPLVLLAGMLMASPLPAQSPERAVVQTVQRTFDAMRTKDTAALRAVFDSSARIVGTSFRNGTPVARTVSVDEFVAIIGKAKEELVERIWDPEVRIDDNIATLWAPYDFHVGGKFSHCGVDAIQLVRTAVEWKIIHIVDTHRTDRCAVPRTGSAGPSAP